MQESKQLPFSKHFVVQVYAQQFPKGVNMPIVTETTVEFLKTQAGLGRQFSY